MISKQLLKYIEKEDKLGKKKKEVEDILLAAGWHEDAVSDAFDVYYEKDNKEKKSDEAKKIAVSVKQEKKKPAKETKKTEVLPEPEEEIVKYKIETAQENVVLESAVPEAKAKKSRVRPIFLIMLSFVLGAAIMMAVSMFFLDKINTSVISQNNATGFEAQKLDDGKRIADVLKIQEELENYYGEHKSYPDSLKSLTDIPAVSDEINYTYTPIGSPPQSYTLNIEMKNTSDGAFKIDRGFLTLKNKQGTK
ncbi:MAG: type IV pilin protein [bacterium]|nr:type IV pilin protein [bacterium]